MLERPIVGRKPLPGLWLRWLLPHFAAFVIAVLPAISIAQDAQLDAFTQNPVKLIATPAEEGKSSLDSAESQATVPALAKLARRVEVLEHQNEVLRSTLRSHHLAVDFSLAAEQETSAQLGVPTGESVIPSQTLTSEVPVLPPGDTEMYFSFNDDKGFVNSAAEPPVPFGWYPPAAGMGGLPPVPHAAADAKSLHDFVDQNLTVRLRGGGILRPYGAARGDLDFASHLFNDIQNPFFVLPDAPGFRLPGSTIAVDPDHSLYSLYPRLTRLGVEYYGLPIHSLGDAVAHARVEVDFLTSNPGGPESRELLRLRLAYGQWTYHDWTVLVGQDWDIVSPMIPSINDNTLQWNAGNTGDRRPQVKILWDHDFGEGYRLQFQNGIALVDAINSIDRDGDGVRDNEYAGVPGYQGRIGFVMPSWVENKRAMGGLWGLWGTQETTAAIAGENNFDLWGYGIDLHIPLSRLFTVRGEFFHGSNLDDYRGGIAQGVNTSTGNEIETSGGWIELVTQPRTWYQNSIGFSVDDPDDFDIPAAGRTQNHSFYIGNRFLLGRGLVFGADIQRWSTHWNGAPTGHATLVKGFMQLNF